jgi:asparagine synthase (glutamine-hydrolysing)
MSGIFGVYASVNDTQFMEMSSRLAHRGQTIETAAISNHLRLGVVHQTQQAGIVREAHLTAVADSWLNNKIEFPAQFAGESEIQHLMSTYATSAAEGLCAINGQFAIALWDDKNEELVLARDYTGSLPLYFARLPAGGIVFASEYKAILAIDEIPARPDLDMIQRLQHYKHLPSEKNLLLDIAAIPPGAVLAFDQKGNVKCRKSASPLRLDVQSYSSEHSREIVAKGFLQAVKEQVSGMDRIGIALSGGIDSIGVACACQQANPDAQLVTFTAGSSADDPEVQIAQFVAEKLGSEHHSVFVTADDLSLVRPLVWHLENPIARTESLQFFKLAQEAGKHVDNLITGVAADGLYAGMPRHKILWLMHLLPFFRGSFAEFLDLTQSGRKPEKLLAKLMDRLYFRGQIPAVPHIAGSSFAASKLDMPANSKEFVNDALCRGFQEAVAQWLPKVERPLRASGISFASPFLDRDFIDLSFTIPSAQKIYRGKEKHILRQALKHIAPTEVLQIPKFAMRMNYDSAFSEAIDDMADKILNKDTVAARGFFDYKQLVALRRRKPGKSYHSEAAMRIWTAMLTEIWAEQYVDKRGAMLDT